MTDDEVGAYNYYLAKERDGLIPKGTSNDYLKSIESTLKARQAGELVDKVGLGEENTILPIKFDFIEGAYGVDQGEVEVVKVDTDEVLKSFDVEFFNQQ